MDQDTSNTRQDLVDTPEAATQSHSVQRVSLEISQNSQENTFARASFLIRLQA